MKIKIKKMSATAKTPTRGSQQAAGYDMYADIAQRIAIEPHKTEMISTGIAAQIPEGYFGALCARSGLAAKQGIRPANAVGIIDSDYTGIIKLAAHNDSDETRYINPGDRICQLVIVPYLSVDFEETDSLDETQRGEGGFGSTGIS